MVSHKILTECDVGLYGTNCERFCNHNCKKPGICEKVTGECEGGCQTGWKNVQCDQGKNQDNETTICKMSVNVLKHIIYFQSVMVGRLAKIAASIVGSVSIMNSVIILTVAA